MELVQLPKQLISVDRGSEDGNDESVLIANSRTVSEVASVFGSQSLEQIDAVPGNTVSMQSGLDSSFVKKTTIVDDGDDRSMTSLVQSLKNFNKSNEDLRKRKQRFNKNKVAPSNDPDSEMERPTSAPLHRDRKWLEEMNMNRPMTAAAKFTLSITPPLQKKVAAETTSLEEEIVEAKEVPKELDPIQPIVKETAYIPYEYAQAMISRIVEDMNKMKMHHLNIITRMEQQYQQMEVQTQEQFDECISQIQEKHSKRLDHFRQVIDVLTAELQSKGSIRAEAIQTLREKNKELALERKKMQQQLSSSKILIVPQEIENRDQKQARAAPEAMAEAEDEEVDDRHSVEGKILEDSQETEKEIVPAPVADASADEEDEEGRKEIDEVKQEEETEDVEKEVEPFTELDGKEIEIRSEIDEEEIQEDVFSEDEMEEQLEKDEEETEGVTVVPLLVLEEGSELKGKQTKEPAKLEKNKKTTKTPTSPAKKESSPRRKVSIQKQAEPVSSADQAMQNKQQIIQAKKHEKRIKELEKAVELERKKLEQSRKSAKSTEADLTEAKNEISTLQKNIAQQKAELAKLEDAAGAGAIALQELPELKSEIKTLTTENQNLVNNYNTERVLRKKYYNMVEDMKGKIRVYCRVRPLSKTEKANKNQFAVQTPDEYTIKVEMNRGGVKEFQFDEIFSETSSQDNVFEDTNSLIQSAVDGYNVCIFAYGQTGSGKTYTMIGDKEQTQPGIAPRAFDRIFNIVKQNKKKFSFKISCYMLELYNEKLVDLLSTGKDDSMKLDIKKDNKGMVVIQGTEIIGAESSEELFDTFQKGSANRHTASTKMNDESSRSHLVIGIIIESTNLVSGAITKGKLSLVDLAGSERVAKTGATAQQLKEANSINKSLSALGDVISALSSEQSFIPYRNNKLTMLMQDSLGGNAKTLMFVNVSPADYNSDETAISLTYAARVKLIKNDATKMADSKEVNRLKQIIAKLKSGEAVDE